jgi:hypothetical protein
VCILIDSSHSVVRSNVEFIDWIGCILEIEPKIQNLKTKTIIFIVIG